MARSIAATLGGVVDVATGVVAICVVAVTVHIFLFKPNGSVDNSPAESKDWPTVVSKGQFRGSPNASVVIAEFADFQCPFCARFAKLVENLRARYPNDVRVVFRHFPLPGHAEAYVAARAAECAGRQRQFWPMHDELFRSQDSLGKLPFREIARRANVPDLKLFQACVDERTVVNAIENDVALGKRVSVLGTPTVMINGMRFPRPPDSLQLDEQVRKALNVR
ncbi:MAG: DsbA family protein [Gemmatimonadaceae bacterium]